MDFTKIKFQYSINNIISLSLSTGLDSFFVKIAILEYDFFNKFRNDGMSIKEIQKSFKIHERSLNVLLPLFTSLSFLVYKKGKYFLTDYIKDYLLKNSEKYMGDFITFRTNYQLDSKIYKIVYSVIKTGKPINCTQNSGDWVNSLSIKKMCESFTKAMDQRGKYLASKVSKKLKLSKCNNLVDIGGSSGIYSCFIAEKFKKLNVNILEIPSVAKNTRLILKKRKFEKRITVIEGDMFSFDYNNKYDVHFYSNVFHDWDKPEVEILIKKSYQGLPKKGEIVIFDGHKELKHNSDSLLMNDINLLMITKGRYYYYYEIKEMLESVGFKKIKKINVYEGRNLIIATK